MGLIYYYMGGDMGIRFLCPNGHRLNVKTFQAGKRGVCPHCGAAFTIPRESTLPSSKEEKDEHEQQLETTGGFAAADDPLSEAPNAAWYVAPPEGGRFGPANAELLRAWVAEGRVTGDSLLWREGWNDWVVAATVLPQLADAPASRSTSEPSVSEGAPVIKVSEPPRASARMSHARLTLGNRRRASRGPSVKVVGFLAALVVVLIVLFIWVMSRS